MFFNDIDPYAAQWLRNPWPSATVDERSIVDLRASDVAEHERVHLFAGIGGWEYALQLAGWPSDSPVWTGSCPCQPFSAAGRAGGVLDERHLWPAFLRLIAECRPPVVFGEQVASRAGRAWFAGVRADLEELGYAVGAADLCAASVGAPHIRQRLFWVADAEFDRLQRCEYALSRQSTTAERLRSSDAAVDAGGLGDTARRGLRADRRASGHTRHPDESRAAGGMGDAKLIGCHREPRWRAGDEPPIPNPWADAVWLPCRDGKARRTQSGLRPLADGIPARVGRLRAYGNAIVPQVAAVFVRTYMEARGG